MIQKNITPKFVITSFMVATLTIAPWSRATISGSGIHFPNGGRWHRRRGDITIVSGPTFTPATNAPLAGLLKLTTDVDSRLSVRVSDGANTWERDFYHFARIHSVPLLGFRPDRTNQIVVTVYDKYRNAYTAPQPLTFVTAPLPTNFPPWTVLTDKPSDMEPGYMLFEVGGYLTIMDNSGEVVWYAPDPSSGDFDVRQLDNGDLFLQQPAPTNNFLWMNMLGETVRTLAAPAEYPVNVHEGVVTGHGTIMYLSDIGQDVSNFPSSDVISNAPLLSVTNVDNNPVVEISAANGALLNAWSPLDILDPTRVTYLTYGEYSGSTYGVDNEHANAIIDDTNDNSIIVSLRDQNAVFKFSRSTGQLKWILGPHELWGANWQPYLLTPVGTPFGWNYGQHAPELTPQGTLLVYDDDNYQASPFDPPIADQSNYSGAVEYAINETNMTVSEIWNSARQTNQDRLYTPFVGRVQWLPKTRNILVDYGAITYVDGKPAPGELAVRIEEYTHDPIPQVLFDVSFGGETCYRAYQISDLYPHTAEPVTDLAVRGENHARFLEFSADPARHYFIQASTDMKHWQIIGPAAREGSTGNFDFEDLNANQFKSRFYRVVTQ